MTQWQLPSLNRIVLDIPLRDDGMKDLWEAFGSQLQSVEFGKSVDFLTNDHLSACLNGCPILSEIYLYALFAAIPNPGTTHAAVSTIGLNAAANASLEEEDGEDKIAIEDYFRSISIPAYPSLQHIYLHGDWRELLSHPPLTQLCQSLEDEGVEIIACDHY